MRVRGGRTSPVTISPAPASVVIAKFVQLCRELGANERDLNDTSSINALV